MSELQPQERFYSKVVNRNTAYTQCWETESRNIRGVQWVRDVIATLMSIKRGNDAITLLWWMTSLRYDETKSMLVTTIVIHSKDSLRHWLLVDVACCTLECGIIPLKEERSWASRKNVILRHLLNFLDFYMNKEVLSHYRYNALSKSHSVSWWKAALAVRKK